MRICHRLNGVKRKALYAPLCVPAGTRTAVGKNKIGSPLASPLEEIVAGTHFSPACVNHLPMSAFASCLGLYPDKKVSGGKLRIA
jgi:hypothetical protein